MHHDRRAVSSAPPRSRYRGAFDDHLDHLPAPAFALLALSRARERLLHRRRHAGRDRGHHRGERGHRGRGLDLRHRGRLHRPAAHHHQRRRDHERSHRRAHRAEQRRARRAKDSAPVLSELRAFVDHHRGVTPPKTPLGQALGYLHRQWPRLVLFVDDGNIELTNNRRERELRRLVLGRKNWLFTWLDEGGERTATILTIVGTCIAHGVDPRAYLHRVTKRIVEGWPQARLRELLPDRMLASNPDLSITTEPSIPPAPD